MRLIIKFFLLVVAFGLAGIADAQVVDTAAVREVMAAKDTVIKPTEPNPAFTETDSVKLKDPHARIPGKAALRSAVLPGWGQVYNKKIWKVPIVYAALGLTGGLFVDNLVWYKRFRAGVQVAYYLMNTKDNPKDSTGYFSLYKDVRILYDRNGVETLKYNRDYFRKNLDYAALYFLIAWGLNVIEATVDAHLSNFDISPDLTFRIQPGYSEMARTSGVSLVLRIK